MNVLEDIDEFCSKYPQLYTACRAALPARQGTGSLRRPTANAGQQRVLDSLACCLLLATTIHVDSANAFCWDEAAARYNINASVLQSIGKHESGLKATAINRNTNGTVDVGVMQINSIHFPELKSYGISPTALWEPCTNVMVGAFLLAKSIKKYGNTWEAVGAYHSRTPTLKERYALQVYRVFSGKR